MGQLRDKRIVQSRIWLDPNANNSIPPYDYDFSYPITVYDAIHRTMDNEEFTLTDELNAIYRLIHEKQPMIPGGTAGRLMTFSGISGEIGETEIVASINQDPKLRSHQKVPSERAVGASLDGKVSQSTFASHVGNQIIHVTDEERARWNSMASSDNLSSHINNTDIHVTKEDKERWDAKAGQSDFEDHVTNLNNPHKVTAHQAGTYNRREIDDMFANLRESFFNYLNIAYDNRTNQASLVEYNEENWNPNYVLKYGDELPDVTDESLTYFALIPATDYSTNETNECYIYIKLPGLDWQQVGTQVMNPGDLVIRFPDTCMFVWIQGRFRAVLTTNVDESGTGAGGDGSGDLYSSILMWRPVITEEGILTWTRSEETVAPDPISIIGPPGKTPVKGVDYHDGADGMGVPIGGNMGDLLVKVSGADYDTKWENLVTIIQEALENGLPTGIITWDNLEGRPDIFDELGYSKEDLVTQNAVTVAIDGLKEEIKKILALVDIETPISDLQDKLEAHLMDTNNPHRVTPAGIGAPSLAAFTAHVQSYNNPHNVTKEQIGLGNVDNTSDLDKPISYLTQRALNELAAKINAINTNLGEENLVTDVKWDLATTTITFTFRDDTELAVELPIVSIFQSITYDAPNGELVITLPDGTEHRIDISKLVNTYLGSVGTHIKVDTDGNTIRAEIIPSSITGNELIPSITLRENPTTTTQAVDDRSTRIATTEFVKVVVIDNLISYETDRPLSANMGRVLNEEKADIDDVIQIINDLDGVEIVDNLESSNAFAALSANMGRYLDVTKAPRVHTSPSGSTFGRATLDLFGHVRSSNVDPLMDGNAWKGTDDGYYARSDHRHPTDVTRAPMHWPDVEHNQYCFTGEPRSTLPPDNSNDSRIATTEWVRRNGAGCMYGTCRTAGSELIKEVVLQSSFMEPPVFFLRQIGSTVAVTFMNEDRSGHDEPTMLDVQGSGPAEILYGGFYMKNGMIGKDHTHLFVFDGTYWRLINPVAGTGLNGDRGPDVPLWPDEGDEPGGSDKGYLISFDEQGGTFISWPGGKYTITFDTQGGDTPMITLKTDADGYLTAFPTVIRDGYVFAGWFTQPNGEGEQINLDHQFTADDTLYAKWVQKSVDQITITLDPMGGSVSPEMILAKPNEPIGSLPTPVRDDYVFGGWFTKPLSGGDPVYNTSTFPGDTTIYARWDNGEEGNPINKLSGYQGFTTKGDGEMDGNGNVSFVYIAMNYEPRLNDVRIEVSRGASDFAVLTGSGTQLRCFAPKVLSATRSSALIQFQMEDVYPSNSPVQLMYARDTAYINIIEVDENGDAVDDPEIPQTPVITTATLPNGVQGQAYHAQLESTGELPIVYAVHNGFLPNGLSMDENGTITGTPEKVESSTFTIRAVNNFGSIDKDFMIYIDYPPVPEDDDINDPSVEI